MKPSAVTPQTIAERFHDAGYSNADISLLVSAHAGRVVHTRTILGIRSGEYSGHNLWPAFLALARAWRFV